MSTARQRRSSLSRYVYRLYVAAVHRPLYRIRGRMCSMNLLLARPSVLRSTDKTSVSYRLLVFCLDRHLLDG